MNIQQEITRSNRNQPVPWEHTINIWAVASGITKGKELKRGEGKARKTKTTAVRSVLRGICVKKQAGREAGSRSHGSPRKGGGRAGWHEQQRLQYPRALPWACFIRLDQIRQPTLFEFQLFPLKVWFNCLAIQAHAHFAMLWSQLH